MRASTRIALMCVVAAGLVALSGCTPTPSASTGAVKVGEAASGTEVRLQSGQTLEIALSGNVTTGFDWALDGALPSQVTSVTDEYVQDPALPGAVGAGGTHTFIYKAAASGTGKLSLKYSRSFESGTAPAQLFTITVVVP
jgi:inhibitor of cysteine peptidase